MESRGNEKYGNGGQIGVERVFSTLHFGPRWDMDAYQTAGYSRNKESGFDKDFHKYEMLWDENGIKFFIDGTELGFAAVDDGFWKRGGFSGDNIWAEGTKMAPFDQEVRKLSLNSIVEFGFKYLFIFTVSFSYQFGGGWYQRILS